MNGYFAGDAARCRAVQTRPAGRVERVVGRLCESVFRRLPGTLQTAWLRALLRRYWAQESRIVRLASLAGDGRYVKRRYAWSMQGFFCAHIRPGWRVLDAGCGTGELTSELCRVAGEVVACDRFAAGEFACRAPNVRYVTGDIEQAFPDGPFDAVVLSAVLSLVRDPGRLLDRLRDLSPRLLIRETKFDYHVMPLLAQELEEPGTRYPLLTKAELVQLLQAHRWEIMEEWDSFDLFLACEAQRVG